MDGYGPSTYGDRFADVYDDWFGNVSDAEATVRVLVELARAAGDQPVLELGAGSGRLAVPLAAAGVAVVALDSSPAMLDLLRAKDTDGRVVVLGADMASLPFAAAPFGVVFVAFNTLFNLGTAGAQQRCFAEVAAVLTPEGRFVVEGFVPEPASAHPRTAIEARTITADRIVLVISKHEPGDQTVTGQHVELTEGGVRLRPWHVRYAPPEELDRFAADAGLRLVTRHGGWASEPFDTSSATHVSVYALDRG